LIGVTDILCNVSFGLIKRQVFEEYSDANAFIFMEKCIFDNHKDRDKVLGKPLRIPSL
jgi:hypothetical protein